MNLNEMNQWQKSLLLYLETRIVDHGGLVDTRHMNEEDKNWAEEWNNTGFIHYGRIYSKDIEKMGKSLGQKTPTHWCEFSDEAWALAHEERRQRAKRLWEKRTWKKGEEK